MVAGKEGGVDGDREGRRGGWWQGRKVGWMVAGKERGVDGGREGRRAGKEGGVDGGREGRWMEAERKKKMMENGLRVRGKTGIILTGAGLVTIRETCPSAVPLKLWADLVILRLTAR
jgi:hypothetical protein